MTTRTVLFATWGDGLFVVTGENCHQELAGQPVSALASDGHGGALAIVSRHSLQRRTSDGQWRTLATSEFQLACCVPVADVIYVGTDDARILRVSANGNVEQLRSFEAVAGRDTWYAGSAVINGQRVGPPLGIRSIAATADGRVVLANVHVGGIPRSTDSGATWQPTIDIDTDVHEVDVLVCASVDHFASQGAIYRRRVDGDGPLVAIGGGLPTWIDGIADTRCIATHGSAAALADRKGNLYISADTGRSWSRQADGLPTPSSVLIV